MASRALTSKEKVRNFRERQKAKGLRLVQYWVPDVRSPEWKAEARRQSYAIGRSEHEAEEQAWIDAMIDMDSWPAWDPKEA
jgi:Protein  of unknown function (DUF3018)